MKVGVENIILKIPYSKVPSPRLLVKTSDYESVLYEVF